MSVRHCMTVVFFMITWGLMAMSFFYRETSIGDVSLALSFVLFLFCLVLFCATAFSSKQRAPTAGMWLLLGGTLLVQIVMFPAPIITMRAPSPTAKAIAAGEGIRAALANFAADSVGYAFPASDSIRNDATLRAIVNENGGALSASELDAAFRFVIYEAHDTDGDGRLDQYVLILALPPIIHCQPFSKIRVTPDRVERLSGKPTACSLLDRVGLLFR